MPNPNKTKGTRFESAVTKVLVAAGLTAWMPRQTGRHDVGDIHVGTDLILQAKAWKDMTGAIRVGTAAAQVQAGHANREFGAAVIKKPRGRIEDAYVVMPLHAFIRLLHSRGA